MSACAHVTDGLMILFVQLCCGCNPDDGFVHLPHLFWNRKLEISAWCFMGFYTIICDNEKCCERKLMGRRGKGICLVERRIDEPNLLLWLEDKSWENKEVIDKENQIFSNEWSISYIHHHFFNVSYGEEFRLPRHKNTGFVGYASSHESPFCWTWWLPTLIRGQKWKMRNRYCGHSFETRPGEETRDPVDPGLSKKKGWDPGLFYIYIYIHDQNEKSRGTNAMQKT